jgi:hypothetical protein
MSIAALALLAALAGPAPVQDQAPPRVETRSMVRIITRDGDGTGRLDADGDGVVTREEFSAPMGTAFDRLDADHDGRLSAEELANRSPGGPGDPFVIHHGGPGMGPDGDNVFVIHADRLEGGPLPGGPGQRRFVIRTDGPDGPGRMDADGDGKVSEAEFLAPLREAFQRMDADHDGSLDESEHGPPPPPAH